jgi:dephospho-CoA kinase
MFENAIVLTGGIATGKSTVANLFIHNGFSIIDADKIAHKVLDENANNIARLFGTDYISENTVLRKKLGRLIFSNSKEKKKLENFMHPLIKECIIKESNVFEEICEPYLIDIPLFFENKSYNIEKVILVYAPKDIQIKRLSKRDNSTIQDAMLRIDSQIDIEEKKQLTRYVIDNSRDLASLKLEVRRVKKEILK